MAEGPIGYRCLLNARAGGVDDQDLARVTDLLARTGARTSVAWTGSVAEVEQVVDELPASWALVVCGGDGSHHVALQALRDAGRLDVPVGLVPMGTGNDLARGLGIELDDPAAAADRIARGRCRALDLLIDDDGGVCVNALHVGVGADAAARAADLKGPLSELAYPVGALLAGIEAPGLAATLDVDGERVVDGDELLLVAVCNGPSLGGGTRLAPDARPDDGLLEVVAVAAVDAAARVGFGADLQRGRHLARDDVQVHRGGQVVIDMPGARHDVDGEVTAPRTRPRRWRVERAAWRLLS